MLNHDEEEILKILLKLNKEQNALKISGSFSDFPIKYQIVYKEILERLQTSKYIADFESFIGEDFVLTLLPKSLNYFTEKIAKISNTKSDPTTTRKVPQKISSVLLINELESYIMNNETEDKKALLEITEEIKEFCENLKSTPTVQHRKTLIKKIANYSIKYPWFYEMIAKIIGTDVMEIMIGK